MPGRVLIVDDIDSNLRLLEAKLAAEYFDVVTADSGDEALRRARSEAPDLVLLDVMMPGMDGFETCRRLKSDPVTSHIPVIMVTALSDSVDRVRGLEAGADDFLTKPVRDLPLFARARSLIRLKLLTDIWQLRESTAMRLGLTQPLPPLAAESANHGSILLVDSDADDSAELAEYLEADGHDVTATPSWDEAMQLVAEDGFELLIAAMRIEGDILRHVGQLRSARSDRMRSLPLLLLAEGDQEMARLVKGLDIGVNDYLTRPLDHQELIARTRTQIRRWRYHVRLRENFEASLAMASIDSLTGAYNRRYLDAHLDQLLERARVNNKPLSLAYTDIDRFKLLNDEYGHDVGDQVLVEYTRRLNRNLRSMDLVARIGGEEFLVVMPDAPPERALAIAERLRQKIEETPFRLRNGHTIPVTVSIGVTTCRDSDHNGREIQERADFAMLTAKRSGRNRVVADLPEIGLSLPGGMPQA